MKKIAINILLITILIFSVSCSKDSKKIEEQKALELAVEVLNPTEGSVSKNVIITGMLKPIKEVTIFSKVMGIEKITDLSVREGDFVEDGDILVKIDGESIKDQIDASYLSFKTARSNYNQMKSNYETSKTAFENSKKLYEEGAISKDQFEMAEIQASNYQNEIIKGQLEQSEKAYAIARKKLEDSTIIAPINGIVSAMNFVEDGYATSQSFLKISDTSKLKIDIEFTERIVNQIKIGRIVKINIPYSGRDDISGEIKELNTVANEVNGLYKAVVVVDNEDFILKSGMVGKVDIPLEENMKFFVLPVNSVLSDDEGYYVYTVLNSEPIKKRIKIGDNNGEIVEILEGIDLDDKVVVKGQELIKDSVKVRVVRGE